MWIVFIFVDRVNCLLGLMLKEVMSNIDYYDCDYYCFIWFDFVFLNKFDFDCGFEFYEVGFNIDVC